MGLKKRRERAEKRTGRKPDVECSKVVETAEERLRFLQYRQHSFNSMWKDMLCKLLYICAAHSMYSTYTYAENQITVFHELVGIVCLYFTRSYVLANGTERESSRDILTCAATAIVQTCCWGYLAMSEHRIVSRCLPLSSLLFLMIFVSLTFMRTSSRRLQSATKELLERKRRSD